MPRTWHQQKLQSAANFALGKCDNFIDNDRGNAHRSAQINPLAKHRDYNYISNMITISFVWDQGKAVENLRKHDISFEEAQTVFTDPNARLIFDIEHSKVEDRFVILGISSALRLLVVCHCYRENDIVIRIISARKATKQEQKQYGSFYHEK